MPERLRRLDYTFSSCQFISSRHVLINGRRSWIALIFTRALLSSEKTVQSTGHGWAIRPDARSLPCICCDRRSTTGSLRLDEVLEECFLKSFTRPQRAVASLAKRVL